MGKTKFRGAIAWMASNSVAANLLMVMFLVGGLVVMNQVKQEVFPEFELDLVTISVPYPGASPAEVEQGIVLAIEEAVRGLDGVKKVTASASEGAGAVTVELITGSNANKALQDIKNAVDRITSFPREAERPIVSLVTNRREVISLILHGDVPERSLRLLAEEVREELLNSPNITNVELQGIRPYEIAIEVPHQTLRAYNLTLQDVANAVRSGAVELPAGGVKTSGGEILLRTAERRDYGSEFYDIPVVTRPDGTQVRLGDIAQVRDDFRDTDQAAYFNGERAVQVRVFRLGPQKPITIAEEVKAYAKNLADRLPEEIGVAIWMDTSEMYSDRINLLARNAFAGLILVLIVLGLFLDLRLAFWVTLGIPISILGSFLIFSNVDVSINMISLFAFIVTLGIVVDDAVVVGENIYEMRERGMSYLEAAIQGTRQIAVPVTFSILTNVAAFAPMLFIPGLTGKFFKVIPIITIAVFLISLIESLFVLPAHLAHEPNSKGFFSRIGAIIFWPLTTVFGFLNKHFTRALDYNIHNLYRPVLEVAIRWRYLTVAASFAILILTFGLVGGGHVRFTFLPKIDADVINVTAQLPFGAPIEDTRAVAERLQAAANEVLAANGGVETTRGMMTYLGSTVNQRGVTGNASHLATVLIYLVPSEARSYTASQFAKQWREKTTDIYGLESLVFDYSTGPSAGKSIDLELSHSKIEVLEQAAADLAARLSKYSGAKDIDDGFSAGKPQLDFTMKPQAEIFGITATELGSQLRNAFYGQRALRQQRGRDEIWVMVRLPEAERRSLYDVGQLLVRTRQGGEIPIAEAADIQMGRAYTVIKRRDGRRVVNITADVNAAEANAGEIIQKVVANDVPAILAKYPGLSFSLEGEQREQRESLTSLGVNTIIAMLVIFAMLAIPFRSYVQPAIVMTAIPFGIVGAVLGHIIMDYDLSVISMMGIIALAGVVVNDSLVLIHAANRYFREGMTPLDAILRAGTRRFRPILLTSLTTFFGLAPMIMETSVQARFLIPMAVSLGFGILFATFIILLLVPALYMVVEDLVRGSASLSEKLGSTMDDVAVAAPEQSS